MSKETTNKVAGIRPQIKKAISEINKLMATHNPQEAEYVRKHSDEFILRMKFGNKYKNVGNKQLAELYSKMLKEAFEGKVFKNTGNGYAGREMEVFMLENIRVDKENGTYYIKAEKTNITKGRVELRLYSRTNSFYIHGTGTKYSKVMSNIVNCSSFAKSPMTVAEFNHWKKVHDRLKSFEDKRSAQKRKDYAQFFSDNSYKG